MEPLITSTTSQSTTLLELGKSASQNEAHDIGFWIWSAVLMNVKTAVRFAGGAVVCISI